MHALFSSSRRSQHGVLYFYRRLSFSRALLIRLRVRIHTLLQVARSFLAAPAQSLVFIPNATGSSSPPRCHIRFHGLSLHRCIVLQVADAVVPAQGDRVVQRQHQADLSKTISQQWRLLSAEEREYWDDLARQRKKEHKEMYSQDVYQLL